MYIDVDKYISLTCPMSCALIGSIIFFKRPSNARAYVNLIFLHGNHEHVLAIHYSALKLCCKITITFIL